MIHRYTVIDSTNTHAKRLAEEGAPNGTFVIAEHQTGGRGRLGRSFHSPSGSGIYLSMVLRPELPPSQLMHLTCAAAVAACDAVEESTGIRPGIKWTNDLVIGKKKLGGILTELCMKDGLVSYAIIGIGINCTQKTQDFPPELLDMATSLHAASGQAISKDKVEESLIRSLLALCTSLSEQKTQLLSQYRKDCITLGQQICVLRGDDVRHGTALDIDEEGALIVLYTDGESTAVSSGEVSIRGMYGYV